MNCKKRSLRAVDTNLVVRLVVRDDPQQVELAEKCSALAISDPCPPCSGVKAPIGGAAQVGAWCKPFGLNGKSAPVRESIQEVYDQVHDFIRRPEQTGLGVTHEGQISVSGTVHHVASTPDSRRHQGVVQDQCLTG